MVVLGVVRIADCFPRVGVTVRSTDVFGRAWAVTFDATRNGPIRTDHHHFVFPAIAEVVEVGEASRHRVKRHLGLVAFVLGPVEIGHSVADALGDELMQV